MFNNLFQRNIFQTAWVVDDVESACDSWTKNFGVGPFYVFEFGDTFTDVLYRGKPGKFHILLALAQAGQTQIELIQPIVQESVYRDSVDSGTTGFHHVCAWTNDLDADLAKFREIGCASVFSATNGDTRFAYFDTRRYIGCMFEIVDRNEEIEELFKMVADASISWDGTNPIRKGN